MATPVHYIRTIHTSFTAAHPHSSSAWASSSVARAHAHANVLLAYNNNMPSLNKYPPGLAATTGRKRSQSIRAAPPTYPVQRMQPQRAKFDPFAEDSEPIPPTTSVLYNTPTARTRASSMPYTIQIPPAAPADIQRHHHQQRQHQYRQQQQPSRHPPSPQSVRVRQQPVQRVSTPAVPPATRAPSPPAAASAAKEREARSKIVAGILLNRVHAVGKPMRRRSSDTPRPYVPSGLSTCIAIEA